MNLIKLALVATFSALMIGCASAPSQTPVQFTQADLLQGSSITVAMTEVPSPGMSYPGAGCLLCVGVAAAANSGLSSHIKTLPNDELESLGADVKALLSEKGLEVQSASAPLVMKGLKKSSSAIPNSARKDFTSLKDQYKTSHLLVIDVSRVGMSRNYANYVPTSEPYVIVSGLAYMVNLETNTYDWYLTFSESNHADGEWKESPDYPSLSNTYYESVERVREKVLSALHKI